jgi:hypothetical protein
MSVHASSGNSGHNESGLEHCLPMHSPCQSKLAGCRFYLKLLLLVRWELKSLCFLEACKTPYLITLVLQAGKHQYGFRRKPGAFCARICPFKWIWQKRCSVLSSLAAGSTVEYKCIHLNLSLGDRCWIKAKETHHSF